MPLALLAHLRVLKLKDYMTLGNAASGALAIAMALARDPLAWVGVFLGFLFDAFDGVVARGRARGKPTANLFGVQIDSLADAVTFGVAPLAVLLAPILDGGPLYVSAPLAVLTFVAGVFYLSCILVRLALFNLQKDKGHFEGLPAPAAALVVTFVGVLAVEWAWLAFLVAGALAASSFKVPKPRFV